MLWLRLMASNRIICGAYRRAGTQDLINWFGFELADRAAAGCGVGGGGGMYKEKKEKEKVLLLRSLSSAACLTSQSLSLFILFLQIYASGLNLYLS